MMWEEKIFYERRDAKEEGREEGRTEERLRVIKKKLEKNKTVEQIAEDLEITIEDAEEYVRMLLNKG